MLTSLNVTLKERAAVEEVPSGQVWIKLDSYSKKDNPSKERQKTNKNKEDRCLELQPWWEELPFPLDLDEMATSGRMREKIIPLTESKWARWGVAKKPLHI